MIVYPPHECDFRAEENIIVGNVCLYGAVSVSSSAFKLPCHCLHRLFLPVGAPCCCFIMVMSCTVFNVPLHDK